MYSCVFAKRNLRVLVRECVSVYMCVCVCVCVCPNPASDCKIVHPLMLFKGDMTQYLLISMNLAIWNIKHDFIY